MSRTVYAVVSGEYSDYRVHAVFLDRSMAEKAAKLRHDYQHYLVEEMRCYEYADPAPKVVSVWRRDAMLGKDGRWQKFGMSEDTVEHVGPEFDPPWTWNAGDNREPQFTERRRATAFIFPTVNGLGWSLQVAGPSKESVDKLFSEKKARMLVDLETLGDALPHKG